MRSMDGSQPLQGQRRQGHPVPAPVEAVVHFGYPPDLVSSTYQQLLSTSGSPRDIIHTTGNDATGSRTAENGYVSAALLLVSVEANINFASSSLQSRREPDLTSLPTTSDGTLTRCQNADDLQGDGSGDGSAETSSRSSSPRRHQNVTRDHERDSPASSLDLSTPSTPTTTEPAQWTSSAAPAAAGTSTGNTTIPTMPSTGVSANVSSAETATMTTAPSAANDRHSDVSSSSETPTPTTTTTTITSGDAASSGDAAGSQHRDLDGTTLTAFQVTATSTATSTTTSTATSTTTSSHVVQRDTTPADDKARERRRQLERLRALRAENRRLKARSVCRQCRHRPVALTFLPCGHFLFCQECGSSFSACPVCKKTILADVRTFVS